MPVTGLPSHHATGSAIWECDACAVSLVALGKVETLKCLPTRWGYSIPQGTSWHSGWQSKDQRAAADKCAPASTCREPYSRLMLLVRVHAASPGMKMWWRSLRRAGIHARAPRTAAGMEPQLHQGMQPALSCPCAGRHAQPITMPLGTPHTLQTMPWFGACTRLWSRAKELVKLN